ncbi:hypothetical protein M0R19_06705 [Candidatus Pacearchaeota archaeon]|nr:hypothetical protein [Candidatus Pacearchaeota archaeon]
MIKINQQRNKAVILMMVTIQIFLMIVMTPANSYNIYQADAQDNTLQIGKIKNDVSEIINSGLTFLIGFLSIKQIGSVSAATLDAWCCPETKTGEKCKDILAGDEDSCSVAPLRSACSKTSCKLGTCIDRSSGTCSVGSQSQCGTNFIDKPINNVDECKYGCCSLKDGTKEYVRQIKCKKDRGDSQGFDSSVSQSQCGGVSSELGACVLVEGNCKFGTESNCEGKFYKGNLCSNPSLGTKCTKPENGNVKTQCKDNKVYFLDSCGNIANIYNANKIDETDYWNFVQKPDCNVNAANGVLNSNDVKSCGNCNGLTSICGASSESDIRPTYDGGAVCKDLNCGKDDVFFKKFERNPLNQESWCVYESYVGDSKDTVGSAYWRRYCDKGVIKTELCDEYRMQVCGERIVEEGASKYSEARCRANEGWKCSSAELENYKFDTNGNNWIQGKSDTRDSNTKTCEDKSSDCRLQSFDLYFNPWGDYSNIQIFDFCVSKYPPGFQFWSSSSNSPLCSAASSAKCITQWKRRGSWECIQNCDCLSEEYANQMNALCTSLGDCGGKANVVGVYSKNFKTLDYADFEELFQSVKSGHYYYPPYVYTWEDQKETWDKLNLDGLADGGISDEGAYTDAAKKENIGAGDPPKFFTDAELGQFGGDPIAALAAGNTAATEWIAHGLTIGIATAGLIATFAVVAVATSAALAAGLTATAIGTAAAAGTSVAVGTALGTLATTFVGIPVIGWIMLAILAIAMAIIYGLGLSEEPITVEIEFTCQPWQAPVGGDDCDKCDDGDLPCTEYKCRSLGASCKLATEIASEKPVCINSKPNDVTPPQIEVNQTEEGYSFTEENINGGIFNSPEEDNCIQEFSQINFTLRTIQDEENEYAKCVYSWTRNTEAPTLANNYALDGEEFAEGNLYSITHNFNARLPFVLDSEKVSNVNGNPGERNGELTMYVRCMDYSGNYNVNEYAIRFCVKEAPDRTAAKIVSYFPADKSYLPYGTNESNLIISLNEPAKCRLSYDEDKDYEQMTDFLQCEIDIDTTKTSWDCRTSLTNLNKAENKIYIKCKDQPWVIDSAYNCADDTTLTPEELAACQDTTGYAGPWTEQDRNVNVDGFLYTLYSSTTALKIDSISPKGDVIQGTGIFGTTLYATTSGGAYGGNAKCSYQFLDSNTGGDWFFETGTKQHKQILSLFSGTYNILVSCEDNAKNKVESSTLLNLIVDTSGPKIVRAYKDGDYLKVITDELAKCYYDNSDCEFSLDEKKATEFSMASGLSTVQTTKWQAGVTYYIRCEDEFGNINQECAGEISPTI